MTTSLKFATTTSLQDVLDSRADLRRHLYVQGFLFTSAQLDPLADQYPFYSNWTKKAIGPYALWCHNRQQVHLVTHGDVTVFMVGHAYDPFNMSSDEDEILARVAAGLEGSTDQGLAVINALTGVFFVGWLVDGELRFMLDASGMQYACYGVIDGKLYITSHMQLVGDICGLDQDDYVKRLKSYRWYPLMMGNYLPGDLTAFKELKRVIPNTFVEYRNQAFRIKRFFPASSVEQCSTEAEYQEVVAEGARILRNTMALIAEKWQRPAISLTGGVDSGTTFAAANGLYDKFTAFTYVAMGREARDAVAAKAITGRFGVPHTVIDVPDNNSDIPDFDLYKQILVANAGDIGPLKDDDTRKKIILMQADLGDVEVKSWISETVRAYAYKYFGRTRMPRRLKPRHYTSLFKIFLADRHLAAETDQHFDDYLERTQLQKHLEDYDESDFFVWEMMHGGKCGPNIGSMKFCFDITIPFNNRDLMNLLLRAKLPDRLSDRLMLDIKRSLNPELASMDIHVVNANETRLRKAAINLYFIVNSRLPF